MPPRADAPAPRDHDHDHGDLAVSRVAAPAPGPQAARARAAVLAALEASDVALAAWEGGSAGFGRADATSDVDVGVLCADGAGERVLDEIEAALRAVTADLDVWRVGTALFGVQRFWQPRGPIETAPMCMVDASVIEHDAQRDAWRSLLLPERHGRAIPLHDPTGVLAAAVAAAQFEVVAHRAAMATELRRIRARRTMFGAFGAKELARGRVLDAHWIHQAMVIAPLVTLLGMVHRPLRYDFNLRYLHEELPQPVVERLVPIVEPERAEDLQAAMDAGLAWIDDLLGWIDLDELPVEAHAREMRAAFG